MLKIGWFSAQLFFKGKLLRDPIYFAQKIAIATSVGLPILVLLALIKLPLWLPIAASSLITGAVMPFLLKDFKMK
jgi:hypothetical protein